MKWIKYYSLMILLYIFQTVLGSSIRVMGILPDPVFVLAVYVALKEDRPGSLVFGLVAGLIKDFSLMQTFGLNGFITLYTVLMISLLSEKYFYPSMLVNGLFVFVSDFLYQSLYFFLRFAMWGRGDFIYSALNLIIPQCVYNLIVSIVIYIICSFMTGDKIFDSKIVWREFKWNRKITKKY